MGKIIANFKLALILIVAFLISLSSCKIAYYPTSFNAPLMSSKGEIQLSGIAGIGNFELQTAYAVTDNTGATLNGSVFSEKKELNLESGPTEVTLNYNYLEAGYGYFAPLGEHFKYEVFGGAGSGKIPADFRNTNFNGTQTAIRSKVFLQPAIGLSTNFVDFIGVVRFSAVTVNKETNFFAEPGVVFRVGYGAVKFYSNAGLSYPYIKSGTLTWDHNIFILGFGIQVKLKGSS